MTALTWDRPTDRLFQTGVDRGVLYLPDGTAVPWNGLTAVTEDSNDKLNSYYLDGLKVYDEITPGDFSGQLKAYTYPPEFDTVVSSSSDNTTPGLHYHGQPAKTFSLSYRTKIGNPDGPDYGYKIHILYNLIAILDTITRASETQNPAPLEFSWKIYGTPPKTAGIPAPDLVSGGSGGSGGPSTGSWASGSSPRIPTVHISIDTIEASPDVVLNIENQLYGTVAADPVLLSADQVRSNWGMPE